MEIFLGKRAIRQVRQSAADAMDDGDTETLREDLIEAFSDEQVALIEQHIDSGDIYEFVSEVLDEWSGEDVEELLELLEGQLSDADIELKYPVVGDDEDLEDEDLDDDELPLDEDALSIDDDL